MTDSFTTIRNLLSYEFSGTLKQQEIEAHLDVLEAELKRYREREPLVQELVEAVMNDPSETPFDEYACLIVRFGSCIKSGATDVASEANAAGSSGSEPTK